MAMFQKRTPLEKEWQILNKKEVKYLEKRAQKKDSALNKFLAEKVPAKMQSTLDAAFEKAFATIFEKGTGMIEKTYKKDQKEKSYAVNSFADEVHQSRKSLRAFSKEAKSAGNQNLILSGAAGIGMGVFGVGLPDIPLFTGMIFRSIYEIALSYGYNYDTEEEQYFILMLIEGAVSYGNKSKQLNAEIDYFSADPVLPADYDRKEQSRRAAGALSKELLYMKFLQGIPVVGAVGGAYDVIYMKNISEYAQLKYQKRFLLDRRNK